MDTYIHVRMHAHVCMCVRAYAYMHIMKAYLFTGVFYKYVSVQPGS